MFGDTYTTLGLPWCRREDWDEFVRVLEDSHQFRDLSYDEWLKGAERAFEDATRVGVRVEKVEIRPDDLVRWCRVNGQNVNSGTCTLMAMNIADAIYSDRH